MPMVASCADWSANAHEIGMIVYAKGGQTSSEAERLRDAGCDRAQGYLYQPAQPAGLHRPPLARTGQQSPLPKVRAVVLAFPIPLMLPGPLDGVRVLDLSQVVSGPICGRMLADLGAVSSRSKRPAGDIIRTPGPARRARGVGPYFSYVKAGKRGVCIGPDEHDTASELGAPIGRDQRRTAREIPPRAPHDGDWVPTTCSRSRRA